MTSPADGIEVDDVPAESRFVVHGSGGAAELEYHLNGKRLVLIHTEVPDAWEGRGVGGQLVRAALRRAASRRADRRAVVSLRPSLAADPRRRGGRRHHRLGHAPAAALTNPGRTIAIEWLESPLERGEGCPFSGTSVGPPARGSARTSLRPRGQSASRRRTRSRSPATSPAWVMIPRCPASATSR